MRTTLSGDHTFASPTHTYHRFGLSVELCGDLCPSLLDPDRLFHHTCILGISLPAPVQDYLLQVVKLSFLFSQPRKVVKTPYHLRGNLDFWLIHRLSPIYLPSPRPIPSPVYEIISRCPMYRIRVASDSADNLPVFSWFSNSSDQYQKFNSQLRRSLEYGLDAGSNPRHSSIWVSPPKSCYSRWEHRCSLSAS